jgi:Zn-dependent protease with chaperone function
MPKVDLDFQRYVERRKGAREAQTREGAAYAYAGDLKVLRTLERLRPVRLALEGTVRLWRGSARSELLATASKVSPASHPEVHAAAGKCAERLHIAPPDVYVGQVPAPGVQTFGTHEDPIVVVDWALIAQLSPEELSDVLGRELGRIQNGHVVFATALYYLTHKANRFLRWVVTPALIALRGWSRRAQITADRAGLLCSRNLDVSEAVVNRLFADPQRTEALRVFAESAYYRGVTGGEAGGFNSEQGDAKVAEILSK